MMSMIRHGEHWHDSIVVEDVEIPVTLLVTACINRSDATVDAVDRDLIGSQSHDRPKSDMGVVDGWCDFLLPSKVEDPE